MFTVEFDPGRTPRPSICPNNRFEPQSPRKTEFLVASEGSNDMSEREAAWIFAHYEWLLMRGEKRLRRIAKGFVKKKVVGEPGFEPGASTSRT